ncbi:hypothetical protein NUSPORA_02365 [Nucleospora cyclopteri]
MPINKHSIYYGWYNLHLEEIFPNLFSNPKDRDVWMNNLSAKALGIMVVMINSIAISLRRKNDSDDGFVTKISVVRMEQDKPAFYIMTVMYGTDGKMLKVSLQKINTWCSILDIKELGWNEVRLDDYPFYFYTQASLNFDLLKLVENSISQCLMIPTPPTSLNVVKKECYR